MATILFIDSGFGGATIIKKLLKTNKGFNYIFHCENASAPLGNLTKKQLINLAQNIVSHYLNCYNIKLVVIACNTLTIATINYLRRRFKFVKFVGVEPNVKVKLGKTLVLATKYTIKHSKVLKNKNFTLLALPELSVLIDKCYPKFSNLLPYLKQHLTKYELFNNVILGCTHYFLIQKQLKTVFKSAKFYTSVNGVAKQIKRLFDVNANSSNEQIIVLSKKDEKLKAKIQKYLINY